MFDRSFLNEVLTAVEDDQALSNPFNNSAKIGKPIFCPKDGDIDKVSDNASDKVIGDFTHFPRWILNSKAQVSAENLAATDNVWVKVRSFPPNKTKESRQKNISQQNW